MEMDMAVLKLLKLSSSNWGRVDLGLAVLASALQTNVLLEMSNKMVIAQYRSPAHGKEWTNDTVHHVFRRPCPCATNSGFRGALLCLITAY